MQVESAEDKPKSGPQGDIMPKKSLGATGFIQFVVY